MKVLSYNNKNYIWDHYAMRWRRWDDDLRDVPTSGVVTERTVEDVNRRHDVEVLLETLQLGDYVKVLPDCILDSYDIIGISDLARVIDNYYQVVNIIYEPTKTLVHLNNGWYLSRNSVKRVDLDDTIKIFVEQLYKYPKLIEDAIEGVIWYNSEDNMMRYKQADKIVKTKPGRLIKRYGLSDSEVEKFNNVLLARKTEYDVKILTGRDILWAYLETNYDAGGGSLNNSCMRFENKQTVIDFYTRFPETISLIALLNKETGKISARALVWKLDNGKLMGDRIYSCHDFLYYKMIEILPKWGITSRDLLKDQEKKVTLTIENADTVKTTDLPYLDTLYYGIINDNKLTLTSNVLQFRHN